VPISANDASGSRLPVSLGTYRPTVLHGDADYPLL